MSDKRGKAISRLEGEGYVYVGGEREGEGYVRSGEGGLCPVWRGNKNEVGKEDKNEAEWEAR